MSEERTGRRSNRDIILWTVSVVAVIAIVFVFGSTIAKDTGKQSADENIQTLRQESHAASRESEKSNIAYIQSELDVYYVSYGYYPTTEKSFVDGIEEASKRGDSLSKSLEEVKDLDYQVRGDGEAYRLSYKNVDGKTTTVEGSYDKDFH